MRPRGRRGAAAVLVVATLLTTLGMGVPRAWATLRAPKRACALLREREIERVLDAAVTKTRAQQPVGAALCTWTVDGSARARLVAVYLARGDDADHDYQVASDTYTGGARERVSGLGRKAFYAVPVSSVYLLRGGSLVYVQNVDGTAAADATTLFDQAVTLAKIVSRRL